MKSNQHADNVFCIRKTIWKIKYQKVRFLKIFMREKYFDLGGIFDLTISYLYN